MFAATKSVPLCDVEAAGWYTVSEAAALTCAEAETLSHTTTPTTIRIRIKKAISRRRPPRRLGAGLAATVAMLPGKDSSQRRD